MKVTIGIPVWNGAAFVLEAIRSARAQTHEDLEILIADNGSTDATRRICLLEAQQDSRIRVLLWDENRGAAANFNRLVDEAQGDCFWWLPHDDRLHPLAVEACLQRLSAAPTAISCHPLTQYIDERGEVLDVGAPGLEISGASASGRLGKFLLEHRRCDGVLGLHRLEALRRTGLIRAFRGGDEVLFAELALRGAMLEEPTVLFDRRLHDGASLAGRTDEEVNEWFSPESSVKIGDVGRFLAAQFQSMIREQDLSATERWRSLLFVRRWRLRRQLRLLRRSLKDRLAPA